MKIPHIVFSVLFLISCSNSSHYAVLQQADSLMNESPDSAYTLIKSINSKDLSRKNNAYYSLLLTTAQYKKVVPIGNDSLINIAVDYYDNSNDSIKRSQAYMYKGAALSDMGLKLEALIWYKQAENIAGTTDNLTLGLINTRIGELYSRLYIENQEDIDRYKIALNYYRNANHLQFENYTLANIGGRYRNYNIDSAYRYINLSLALARERNDSAQIYESLIALIGVHYTNSNNREVVELTLCNIKQLDKQRYRYHVYKYLGSAYAKLGKVDSAEIYIEKVEPKTDNQKVAHYITLTDIAIAKENYADAYKYSRLSSMLADSIMLVTRKEDLYATDKRFDKHFIQNKNIKLKKDNTIQLLVIILIGIILLTLLITLYFAINNVRRTKKRHDQLILQLQAELELQQFQAVEAYNQSNEKLKRIIDNKDAMAKQILNIMYTHSGNGERLLTQLSIFITQNKQSAEVCDSIIEIADTAYDNIISYIKSKFDKLTIADLLLLSLTCLGYSSVEICVYMGYSDVRSLSSARTRVMRTKISQDISIEKFLIQELENSREISN